MYGNILYLAAKLLHHQEENQCTCTCQYFFPDQLNRVNFQEIHRHSQRFQNKHVCNELLSAKCKKQLTSPPPPCSTAPTKFMSWFLLHLGFLQQIKKKSEGKLQHYAALRCSQAVTTIADGHSEPHLCLKAMHSCEH
jgi:hypothetical protein